MKGKRWEKKIEKENKTGNTKYINSLIIYCCMWKTWDKVTKEQQTTGKTKWWTEMCTHHKVMKIF